MVIFTGKPRTRRSGLVCSVVPGRQDNAGLLILFGTGTRASVCVRSLAADVANERKRQEANAASVASLRRCDANFIRADFLARV